MSLFHWDSCCGHRIHFIIAHLFSWSSETPKLTRVEKKMCTHHVVIWSLKFNTVDSTLLQCSKLKLLLSAFLFHGRVAMTTKRALHSLKQKSSSDSLDLCVIYLSDIDIKQVASSFPVLTARNKASHPNVGICRTGHRGMLYHKRSCLCKSKCLFMTSFGCWLLLNLLKFLENICWT